jgi:hypothetical protein
MPWVKDELWIVMSLRKCALDMSAVSVYMDAANLFERADLLAETWSGANWQVDCSCGPQTSSLHLL